MLDKEAIKQALSKPEVKARLLKAIADSEAEIKRQQKAREVKWVCTCSTEDFCILHTRFL